MGEQRSGEPTGVGFLYQEELGAQKESTHNNSSLDLSLLV
jgi:hypothetical protein